MRKSEARQVSWILPFFSYLVDKRNTTKSHINQLNQGHTGCDVFWSGSLPFAPEDIETENPELEHGQQC